MSDKTVWTCGYQLVTSLFLDAHHRLNYEGVMRIVDAAKGAVEDLRIGLVTNGKS